MSGRAIAPVSQQGLEEKPREDETPPVESPTLPCFRPCRMSFFPAGTLELRSSSLFSKEVDTSYSSGDGFLAPWVLLPPSQSLQMTITWTCCSFWTISPTTQPLEAPGAGREVFSRSPVGPGAVLISARSSVFSGKRSTSCGCLFWKLLDYALPLPSFLFGLALSQNRCHSE